MFLGAKDLKQRLSSISCIAPYVRISEKKNCPAFRTDTCVRLLRGRRLHLAKCPRVRYTVATMPKSNELAGKRYGRLVVLYPLKERGPHGSIRWQCICDCGTEKPIGANYLNRREGGVRSCGCLRKEVWQELGKKYGGQGKKTHNAKHPLYRL